MFQFIKMTLMISGILLEVSVPLAYGQQLYWVTQNPAAVQTARVCESVVDLIINDTIAQPQALTIDSAGAKVYWTDQSLGAVMGANIDGTGSHQIVSLNGALSLGIVLDESAGTIFWSDSTNSRIGRVQIDGTNSSFVIEGLQFAPRGLALDAANGFLFWTSEGRKIFRSQLDGGNIQQIVDNGNESFNEFRGLAIDPNSGKILWPDDFHKSVRRANLDGSGIEEFIPNYFHGGVAQSSGVITIHSLSGAIYWSSPGANSGTWRANIDGTNAVNVVGMNDANDIAAAQGAMTVIWSDPPGSIGRILKGTVVNSIPNAVYGIATVLAPKLSKPTGVAVDQFSAKIYVTDQYTGIHVSNLDGSNFQSINNFGGNHDGIGLDLANSRVYYTGGQSGGLYRQGLAGMPFVPVCQSCGYGDIALDLANRIGYVLSYDHSPEQFWSSTVYRTSLDNPSPDPYLGGGYAVSIALDPGLNVLYLADSQSGIRVAPTSSGVPVSPVVPGTQGAYAVAFDPVDARIYWATGEEIRSCNRDGSDARTVVSGLIGLIDRITVVPSAQTADCNSDGVSDTCQSGASAAPAAEQAELKNRYLSINASTFGSNPTSIRVRLRSLHHPSPPNSTSQLLDYSALECDTRWVGPVSTCQDGNSPAESSHCAKLQCQPYVADWSAIGLVHVTGLEIIPSSEYVIQGLPAGADDSIESNYSSALIRGTARWGDVVEPYQGSAGPLTQPDIRDVAAVVDKFKDVPNSASKTRLQLHPALPDPASQVDIGDVSSAVDAYKGLAYPYSITTTCP